MGSAPKTSDVVLVVDDDQMVAVVIEAILVTDGYEVITAPDGLEAWHIMQNSPRTVGLVITDIMMPNMDGLELARRLRTKHPDVPILLISGFVSQDIEDQLGERVKFLQKPFGLQALLRAVRAARASVCHSSPQQNQVANAD